MFYWFSRGSETLQYEVREISPTRFELTIRGADGRYPDEGFARFVASGLRQDHLRTGWLESSL
jgi:hypothetical protein